jgi:hypothetical protein
MDIEKILKDFWITSIQEHYLKGIICSERNLQAEIYHQLRLFFSSDNAIKIWVEPTLSFQKDIPGLTKTKPDLLITKDNKIICVLELKYKPYGEVDYLFDLKKLYLFSKISDNGLRLITDIHSGNYKNNYFFITPSLLTCFAVICNEVAFAAKKDTWNNVDIPENFLLLTGVVDRKNRQINFSY